MHVLMYASKANATSRLRSKGWKWVERAQRHASSSMQPSMHRHSFSISEPPRRQDGFPFSICCSTGKQQLGPKGFGGVGSGLARSMSLLWCRASWRVAAYTSMDVHHGTIRHPFKLHPYGRRRLGIKCSAEQRTADSFFARKPVPLSLSPTAWARLRDAWIPRVQSTAERPARPAAPLPHLETRGSNQKTSSFVSLPSLPVL